MIGLTQENLNEIPCETPDCTHEHDVVILYSTCHRSAAVRLAYIKAHGILEVTCNQCKKIITRIKVAEK